MTELSPQESAFFYIYPWASAEMCAISSANGLAKTSFGYRNFAVDGANATKVAAGLGTFKLAQVSSAEVLQAKAESGVARDSGGDAPAAVTAP